MISPSPTSKLDPSLARGVLVENVPASATRPPYVKIAVPDTSYELHLVPTGAVTAPVGKRIVGTIRTDARRIDAVGTGGRFIEPVFGRPQRIQGTVVSTDDAAGTVTVNAGVPIIARITDRRQRPGQFQPGQMVGFDALEGATFTPASAERRP